MIVPAVIFPSIASRAAVPEDGDQSELRDEVEDRDELARGA